MIDFLGKAAKSTYVHKFLVSEETVVLRRQESETKIGFIKRVDKSRITSMKDLESWELWGVVCLYEGVEELCLWWK